MADFPRGTTAEHAFAEHEHRDLAPGIDRIHELACAVGDFTSPHASSELADVIHWVGTTLQPHAAWEDAWLYPEIAQRAGTPWATKLMTFEHQQILTVAGKLRAAGAALRREPDREATVALRGHLFGLEALLRAHIEREERFLIPLLEITADQTALRGRSS